MGAEAFTELQHGTDAKQAFHEAASDASYESGSGGYTGTIAEKSSFVVISDTPMWLDEAQRLAEKLLDVNDPRISDKWGPAGAIAVCTPHRTVKCVVEGSPKSDWDALVAQAVRLNRGERLISWWASGLAVSTLAKVTRNVEAKVSRPAYGTEATDTVILKLQGSFKNKWELDAELRRLAEEKVAKKSGVTVLSSRVLETTLKTKIATTTGTKLLTRYIIRTNGDSGSFDKGFKTLAEAKAKAKELAAKPMGPYDSSPKTYTVEAVTRSEEGGALFTASQEILGTTATVEVKYVKSRKEAPETNAWLFFGWASS